MDTADTHDTTAEPTNQTPQQGQGRGAGDTRSRAPEGRPGTHGQGPGAAPGTAGPGATPRATDPSSGSPEDHDVPAPKALAPPKSDTVPDQQPGDKAGNSQEDEGDHPTQAERFREKVQHGLDSVEHGDREEAERIYRSLMLDFRSLKAQDILPEEDQERMQKLYSKLHRAKRPVQDDGD